MTENKLTPEEISKIRNLISEKIAQEYSPNDRFYKETAKHLGNNFEDYYSIRNEFTRDSDRIIYSKAFRRLEHKAQVYSNKRGDHYRTRLTHTLEVTQIARSISRNLGLNEYLAESIALGHDIGHTPFGHAGEDVLDNIMRGKDDLGGKLEFNIDYGGFKHNFNSVKILEIVEKRKETPGLNLTWQTLDGILKHTKVIKKDKITMNIDKKWDLTRFVRDVSNYKPFIDYDYFDNESEPSYIYPLTLEGQVVAIADEIAQREHDLDDSLRDGDLFRFEDLSKQINEILEDIKNENFSPQSSGYELFKTFDSEISELGEIENHAQWKELTSIIISYFIVDVCENTMKNIDEIDNIDEIIFIDENNRKYITKELVSFSKIGKQVNDKIDEFIEKRIINSFNVNRFDGKGKFILRQLFKAYYENPRQMPRKQLVVLVKNIEKTMNTFPLLKDEMKFLNVDLKELIEINENNVDLKNLGKILDYLKLNFNFGKEESNNNMDDNCINSVLNEIGIDLLQNKENYDQETSIRKDFGKIFDYCNKNTIDELKIKDCDDILIFFKALTELHYVYLATICEYISQMTDDYAMKEYRELYLSN